MGKRFFSFLICSLVLLKFGYSQQSPEFTSVELQPTVAYLLYKGTEARMGRIIFHGGKCYGGAKVLVLFNGLQDSLQIPSNEKGLESFDVPFPGPAITKDIQ